MRYVDCLLFSEDYLVTNLKVASDTVYASLVSMAAPRVSVAMTPKEDAPHALALEATATVRMPSSATEAHAASLTVRAARGSRVKSRELVALVRGSRKSTATSKEAEEGTWGGRGN